MTHPDPAQLPRQILTPEQVDAKMRAMSVFRAQDTTADDVSTRAQMLRLLQRAAAHNEQNETVLAWLRSDMVWQVVQTGQLP